RAAPGLSGAARIYREEVGDDGSDPGCGAPGCHSTDGVDLPLVCGPHRGDRPADGGGAGGAPAVWLPAAGGGPGPGWPGGRRGGRAGPAAGVPGGGASGGPPRTAPLPRSRAGPPGLGPALAGALTRLGGAAGRAGFSTFSRAGMIAAAPTAGTPSRSGRGGPCASAP